jgi:hypothetical protein
MEAKESRPIHINIGDWRWVFCTLILCAASVLLSRTWTSYMYEHEKLVAAQHMNEMYEKNPTLMKKAMGGLELPIPKKKAQLARQPAPTPTGEPE